MATELEKHFHKEAELFICNQLSLPKYDIRVDILEDRLLRAYEYGFNQGIITTIQGKEPSMSKGLNRVHLLLGNLDIWIYPDEKTITINKINKIPWGSAVIVPEEATLFEGTYEEFEKYLGLKEFHHE